MVVVLCVCVCEFCQDGQWSVYGHHWCHLEQEREKSKMKTWSMFPSVSERRLGPFANMEQQRDRQTVRKSQSAARNALARARTTTGRTDGRRKRREREREREREGNSHERDSNLETISKKRSPNLSLGKVRLCPNGS